MVTNDLKFMNSICQTNAKELFYTLENIQVDCTNESEERIKQMTDVFENYEYTIDTEELCVQGIGTFLAYSRITNDVWMKLVDDNKTTITYDKFMELFGEEKETTIEKPKHYSKGIDTFSRMEANCTKEECLAFAKGNIDKYNWREKGQDLEDFEKIIAYANWAIKIIKDEK